MVNRTKVNMLNLNIKYMLTVIAMAGIKGSPGVKNASAYLEVTKAIDFIRHQNICFLIERSKSNLFCGCLEIISKITIMPMIKTVKIKPENAPE